MSALANTHAVSNDAALHSIAGGLLANIQAFFGSLGRAIAFSRQCEAEYARTGRVSEQTLSLISDSLPAR